MIREMVLTATAVALMAASHASMAAGRGYVPPLAENALARPAQSLQEKHKAELAAAGTRYSVLIGMRDFATLDKEADAAMRAYAGGKMSGDDFTDLVFSMVPLRGKATVLPDLLAWTQSHPKSYAAWYVLGRMYFQLALEARGGAVASKTSESQFAQMKSYADLSWQAFQKSVALFGRPTPSYGKMIGLEILGGPYPFGDYKDRRDGCLATRKVMGLTGEDCPSYEQAAADAILEASFAADPNAVTPYVNYDMYGVPRWGGSFERLTAAYDRARQSGKASKNTLAAIHVDILWWQGAEAIFFHGDHMEAARKDIEAFEADTRDSRIGWLYDAADEALAAGDKEFALKIYSRIIKQHNGEYRALFQRAEISEALHADHERLFEDLIPSALLGYVYAQNNIGYYYMTGSLGFPKDLLQAKKWLTLAANQGYQHSRDKLKMVDAMLAQAAQEKAGK